MTALGRLVWVLWLLALGINTAHSVPDFSLYLHSVLKNHTAHACEGETLAIECPARTSVAVLSAFFGRRVPHRYLCPSQKTNRTDEEYAECSSAVAIKKVLSECQDERSCQIPVFGPVFGHDPCPLTSKYLLVYYKCRPAHHRTRLVCENERLRLACKNGTVLAIYSASFGHLLHGRPLCPQGGGSPVDMVPRYVLEDVGRGTTDPFMISDYTHGVPERVALYFVSGICAGLVFLLCLFGVRSTLVKDVKGLVSDLHNELKASSGQHKDLTDDLYDDDEVSDASSFRRLTRSYRTTDMLGPSTLTVEMMPQGVEHSRDLPNGDMWPHPDTNPYAIHQITNYSN
ncbi:protein eva-1 homolog C isoform X4 [Phyllopteryx taeniolatus]|uniref:protein eva-1 homolog C isoform X4 n=1 Tax=Phyllopteryx taeniolatus TaxID=161469 RepID=UPI002AD39504|nr:protein eva-1 homolog C isoform X4 [Phyllopteryx taeniolatus]